jgi:hypothetical protein
MFVFGGFTFGLIIGYLAWHAVRPEERKIDLKTVTAFIGVVAGAAITALFPTGSDYLAGYFIGLSIGFFVPAVVQTIQILNRKKDEETEKREREYLRKQAREAELEDIRKNNIEKKKLQEKQYIEDNWETIKQKIKLITANLNEITCDDLKNIDFVENKEILLERFAQESQQQWIAKRYYYHKDYILYSGTILYIYNAAKISVLTKEIKLHWNDIEKYIDNLLSKQTDIRPGDLFVFYDNMTCALNIMTEYLTRHPTKVTPTHRGLAVRKP